MMGSERDEMTLSTAAGLMRRSAPKLAPVFATTYAKTHPVGDTPVRQYVEMVGHDPQVWMNILPGEYDTKCKLRKAKDALYAVKDIEGIDAETLAELDNTRSKLDPYFEEKALQAFYKARNTNTDTSANAEAGAEQDHVVSRSVYRLRAQCMALASGRVRAMLEATWDAPLLHADPLESPEVLKALARRLIGPDDEDVMLLLNGG